MNLALLYCLNALNTWTKVHVEMKDALGRQRKETDIDKKLGISKVRKSVNVL